MIYRFIQPSPHLRAFVNEYCLLHFVFDKNVPAPIKPFPVRPQQCIVFYLRGCITAVNYETGASTTFAKTSVNGPQLSRFDFQLSPDYLMFSVDFQPGALSRFLRLPLTTDFIDERIDAEAMLNPEIHQVHERMANATRYETIVQVIEDYLWKRIQRLKGDFQPVDRVIRVLAENPAAYSIHQLADLACLSISQFERRFTQQMGISPKLFARTNRFHKAFLLKDQNPTLDWLSIALQTGYADYQHLVKDFKQFSGATPNSLLLAQAHAPERILGLG
ncbi:helix-turn-helix domain-containing protein [Spirosoma arcticum]